MKRVILLLLSTLALPAWAQTHRAGAFFAANSQKSTSGNGSAQYNDLLFNDLANVATESNQSSYATLPYQPAPNSLVLAVVINTKASKPDIPTFAGNGLTWVQIGTTNFNTLAAPTERITMFRAQGASPTYSPGTADFAGATQTGCIIQVVEFQGADATAASGANALVQTNFNGANSAANPSVAYATSTLPGTNGVFFAIGDSVNSTTDYTVQTNWVNLRQLSLSTPNAGGVFDYQMNALAATSTTNTATSRNWGGIMVEIQPGLEASVSTRPTLVQYVGLIYAQEVVITNLWFNLPNPTLSGNLLSLFCIHDYGSAMTVTDDKGNNWTLGANYDDPSNFQMTASYFYATNIAPGTVSLKLSFDPYATLFHADCAEFAHVAAYSPVDASAGQESSFPLVNAGSMATTVDGDLIVLNGIDVATSDLAGSGTTTGFRGAGLRFLETDRQLSCIGAYGVQAKAGGIAPGVDISQSGSDTWMNLAIAYKRSSAGTLPSATAIRIARLYETILMPGTSDTTYLPFEGNLQVLTSSSDANDALITDATDVLGNTWTRMTTTNTFASQMFVCSNALSRNNPPNPLTLDKRDFTQTIFAYDIVNASSYPLDTWSEREEQQTAVNADVTNNVSLTPSMANGLAIDVCGFGIGPPYLAMGTPGIILDSVYFYGMDDSSSLSTGDGYAHYFYTNTNQIDFGFHMSNNVVTDGTAFGAAFKSAGNLLPLAGSPTLERYAAHGVKMRAVYFLGTDPDGDMLSLNSAGPTSTAGGVVGYSADWVFYTPPPNYGAGDSFPFTVSDGRGGIAAGTANVSVITNTAQSQDFEVQPQTGGSVRLAFDGIPGRTYAVEYTESLVEPDWQRLGLVTAGDFGAFEYIDTPPQGSLQRFYRATEP